VADSGLLDWSTPGLPARRPVRAQETESAISGGASLDHPVLRYRSDAPSYGLDDDFHLSSIAGSCMAESLPPMH